MTMSREELKRRSGYEDKILNVIDNQADYTRSDLQGVVSAIVNNIIKETACIMENPFK